MGGGEQLVEKAQAGGTFEELDDLGIQAAVPQQTLLLSPPTGVQAIVVENSGYPAAYNIEWDPREEWNLLIENSWVLGPYMKVIEDYRATLKGHPNPPAPNFTDY